MTSGADAGTATADTRLRVLQAFGRALGQEAHILVGQPHLMIQQLHNRLQWEGAAVQARLSPLRERGRVPGTRAWLRTRTP